MDAQLEFYRRWPNKYARTAWLIDICMTIAYRPCAGGHCDVDRHCRRHGLSTEVAERYARLRERQR